MRNHSGSFLLLFLKGLDDIVKYQLNTVNKVCPHLVEIFFCSFFSRAACPVERIGDKEYLKRSLSCNTLIIADAGDGNSRRALLDIVRIGNCVINALGQDSVKALDGDFGSDLRTGTLLRRNMGNCEALILEGEGFGKERSSYVDELADILYLSVILIDYCGKIRCSICIPAYCVHYRRAANAVWRP